MAPTIAAEKRASVAFLTALSDDAGRRESPNHGTAAVAAAGGSDNSTSTVSAAAAVLDNGSNSNNSNSNSNSRGGVESVSRDSRRGRDVKSAEVDLVRYQPLPGSVKLATITEKVLREAPFAVGSSKAIWRAFLTSRPFTELTTDGFWFVVAHEILRTPVDAANSPRFSRMAHVYCHLFTNAPAMFKDVWGSCFFEAWALALLLLLQDSFPKSKPMFDAPAFRMRLLDLCAEWTLGIRPSFPLTGHWVLKFDKRPPTELELLKRRTFGAGLYGSVSTSALSPKGLGGDSAKPGNGPKKRKKKIPEHRLNYVPSRSVIEFGNSPLVNQHLQIITGRENASVIPVRLQVTGEATRTLRPFHEIGLRLTDKDRVIKANAWRAAQAVRFHDERPKTEDILSRIDQTREDLLRQHAAARTEAQREIARMKADAADDRISITAEATDLLSKGDVHEYSNFLVKGLSKATNRSTLIPLAPGGRRKNRTLQRAAAAAVAASSGGDAASEARGRLGQSRGQEDPAERD